MTDDNAVFTLGEYDTEREAALAYDRAMILIHGEDIDPDELNYDPSESSDVTFPPKIMAQILAIRDGKGLLS